MAIIVSGPRRGRTAGGAVAMDEPSWWSVWCGHALPQDLIPLQPLPEHVPSMLVVLAAPARCPICDFPIQAARYGLEAPPAHDA